VCERERERGERECMCVGEIKEGVKKKVVTTDNKNCKRLVYDNVLPSHD